MVKQAGAEMRGEAGWENGLAMGGPCQVARSLGKSFEHGFSLRAGARSAALRRYDIETRFEMLMYYSYIPLSQLFSPCLVLAREIVSTF
ncbi:hypothetical protein [Chromobacterium rhizoryzae]|uniref:hypothetical protein n=1 Tax=Chromobacterium rhizoryzae TaxID=1778675 RepID=UPI001D07BC0E|nr:hypothetical protein [Chromobacterium rhizoryzae]